MNDDEELRAHYERIKDSEDVSDHFKFGRALLQNDSESGIRFHYSLVSAANCQPRLFEWICKKFGERGVAAEDYLLQQVKAESDGRRKARILQLLGGFKYTGGKRLNETGELARQFLSSENVVLRRRALWVIGWLGTEQDIDSLAAALHSDPEGELRAWAATAMMQIFFDHKKIAAKALSHLKKAVEVETDPKAIEGVLISVQEISSEKLGLRADSHEPAEGTKLDAAKMRAERLLQAVDVCSCHA